MAVLDVNSIIILVTLFILFGVFLLFDLFKRQEKLDYLAYIIAVIPVNYLWYLSQDVESISVLTAYVVLFSLWNLCLFRDLIGVIRKTKDFDDSLLFLGLGLLVQLIIAAILPAPQLNPALQVQTTKVGYFYVPDIYKYGSEYISSLVLATRVLATVMILLAIVPMILDIRDEEIPFIGIVIIIAIFIPPFIYLGYLWYVDIMPVLTFLFSVILLIVLLMITRSGNE